MFLGTLGSTTTFLVFYLANIFALGWGTNSLGFPRQQFLIMQMLAAVFFGLMIPVAGSLADRIGGRTMLIIATLLIIAYGFALQAPVQRARHGGGIRISWRAALA